MMLDEPPPREPSPYKSPEVAGVSEEQPVAQVAEPPPWGFWATVGWSLLWFVLFVVTQVAVLLLVLVVRALAAGQDFEFDAKELTKNDGLVLSAVTFASTVVCSALLFGLAALRGWPPPKYLALQPAKRGQTLRWLGGLLLLMAAFDLSAYLTGHDVVPDSMVEFYLSAQWLPLFALALVIAAPIGEELFFRGFFFRGMAASVGPVAAIVMGAVLWSLMHAQYELFHLALIGVFGIYLGLVRLRTGSTTLAILLHAVNNFVALAQTAVYVEWIA
ncbi:MAG: CPBP family intramembrane glutamic endopeptidase [Pirellulales bacterium]